VAGRKSYNQNCPIARGLDVLGERWTLLILRELIGGARRYGDVRAALPGIATNLLADRLRELEDAGLIRRSELPPPVARTVYTLSEEGWRKIPPVIQAVATFGLAVTCHGLAGAEDPPAVTVTATAADLITARLGGTAAERKAALRRWTFDGSGAAIEAMRAAFQLAADPGLGLVNRT
jgi:DNA-binding HxlR family transcriptional regulator